ncbi:MAG: hypothetical protein V5A15_01225, partial [Haloarcula sp.]
MTDRRRWATVAVVVLLVTSAVLWPVPPGGFDLDPGFGLGRDPGVPGSYAELETTGASGSSIAVRPTGQTGRVSSTDADGDGEVELAFDTRDGDGGAATEESVGTTPGDARAGETPAGRSDRSVVSAAGAAVERDVVRLTNRRDVPVAVAVDATTPAVSFISRTGTEVTSFTTDGSVVVPAGATMSLGVVVRAGTSGEELPTQVTVRTKPVEAGASPGAPGGGAGIPIEATPAPDPSTPTPTPTPEPPAPDPP